MTFDQETAETIAPVLAMIGQEARLDPHWTCRMLEAVNARIMPAFHRGQRDAADSTADRIRHGEQLALGEAAQIDDLMQLAHACADEERLIEALHWVSKATELCPMEGEFLRFRASLLERLGAFEEALRVAHEARALGADPASIVSDIDRISARFNRHIEEACDRRLPDFYRQQRDMAACNADRISHGEKIITSSTAGIDDLVQLAHAYAADERLLEALCRVSQAIQLQPDNGELFRFKASILERMARYDEALQAAIEARNLGADAGSISVDVERIEEGLVCHLTELSSCLDTTASLPASMELLCMGRLKFREFIKFIGKIVRAYATKN